LNTGQWDGKEKRGGEFSGAEDKDLILIEFLREGKMMVILLPSRNGPAEIT
jgi:hypothetical protein